MADFGIALIVMAGVVGPLIAWVVWADRRRQREADKAPSLGKEEVA